MTLSFCVRATLSASPFPFRVADECSNRLLTA
jgi:hypothetical protein